MIGKRGEKGDSVEVLVLTGRGTGKAAKGGKGNVGRRFRPSGRCFPAGSRETGSAICLQEVSGCALRNSTCQGRKEEGRTERLGKRSWNIVFEAVADATGTNEVGVTLPKVRPSAQAFVPVL